MDHSTVFVSEQSATEAAAFPLVAVLASVLNQLIAKNDQVDVWCHAARYSRSHPDTSA